MSLSRNVEYYVLELKHSTGNIMLHEIYGPGKHSDQEIVLPSDQYHQYFGKTGSLFQTPKLKRNLGKLLHARQICGIFLPIEV